MTPHVLTLVVPAVVQEGQTLEVTLDGHPLRGVYGISLIAGAGTMTTVTLTMAAAVAIDGMAATSRKPSH